MVWALLLSSSCQITLPSHCHPSCHTMHIHIVYMHRMSPPVTGYLGGFNGSAWLAFFLYSLVLSPSSLYTKHLRPTDVSPLAEFYAARSTLSDHCYPQCHMIHICIHTYIIYHRSYNRLSERFQWFTMNGLLFILFGFFISWLHGQLLNHHQYNIYNTKILPLAGVSPLEYSYIYIHISII